MKTTFAVAILALIISLSAFSVFSQEITLTTTNKNVVASRSSIDAPGLTGSSQAIIVAEPIGDTARQNPHPVGAWYYNDKWHIFNIDHATLPFGLQYKVQIFLKPDTNHFLHLVTEKNLIGGGSHIDNPALNNNPNAQLTIFQNHAPDYRSASLNKYEAQAAYDPTAGKWLIKNVSGERLYPNTAYNIVITSGGTPGPAPLLPIGTTYVPVVPITIVPQPLAPLTVIVRHTWTAPDYGNNSFVNGGACAPFDLSNAAILATDTAIITGEATQHPKARWIAKVSAGIVRIYLCSDQSIHNSLDIRGLKANILVLR